MADLPTVQSQVNPEVQPSAELPMNGTPDAFGASIGGAFENAGEVATRLHRDAVTRANQTATLDADNQVNGFLNQKLYDPKTGLLYQNLGKDAPGAVDKTLSDFDEHVSKVQATLANDEQRNTFQRMAVSRRFELERQLGSYEHHETTRYADETDASAIQLARDAAINNAGTNDPELSPVNFIEKQRAIIADAGQRKGLPPEQIQAQMDAAESATHMGVMDQLYTTGQDGQAKAWFDEHKEEMLPADRARAQKMIDEGTTRDKSRQISDGILADLKTKATSSDGFDPLKVNLEDALAKLDGMGIKDTRIYDATKSRLMADFRDQQVAHQEKQKNVMQAVGQYMDDPANETHEIPIPQYSQLDLQNREAVNLWKKKLDQEGKITTDPTVHQAVLDAAADPEKWETLLATPPEQVRPYLSDKDYVAYQKELAHIKGQVEKRDTKLSQGMISTRVTSDLFKENGLEAPAGAKPGTDAFQEAATRQMRFLTQLKRMVAGDSLEKKRELSEEEIRDHARDLMATQTWVEARSSLNPLTWLNRGLGDNSDLAKGLTTKTVTGAAFDAPFADKLAYDARQIPPSEYQQVIKAAAASGIKLPTNGDGSLTAESRKVLVAMYNRKIADDYRKSVAP